jgi:hypothetical protein
VSALCFNALERANRFEIGGYLLSRTAEADTVSIGYAEVAGKGWCGLRVAGSNDNWG